MKISNLLFIAFICIVKPSSGQDAGNPTNRYWQVGVGLGELPVGGSFKPSLAFGYHFNDKLYAGVIYQFRDQISRNGSSFNAKATGLDGLVSAREEVARRWLLQMRYTPFRNAPYLSAGYVYNGKDREAMTYDVRSRAIDGETYEGSVNIRQSRPAGGGLALGIGYQYNFRNGLAINAEWTPAWFRGYPQPKYSFSGTAALPPDTKAALQERMDEAFKSSVTNLYKVFHFGLSYRFR
ncbi:MAG: hypothetical protein H6560_26910 [Lewinellaceae bacterium]|nr:hypothetical protein [Lewinellaceae bacterium]